MIKLIAFALVFVGIQTEVMSHDQKTLWKNCDKDAPLQFTISKFPNPLMLEAGNNVTLSVGVINTKKIPRKLTLDIDIWKRLGIWIKIPCVKGAGSCDYDLSCKKIPALCLISQMCENCEVKVKDIVVQLPKDLSVSVPSFLVNGRYWIQADILDTMNDGARVGCVKLYFNIKKP